jgi:NADH:ubiquinone oxidoreductase subunit H
MIIFSIYTIFLLIGNLLSFFYYLGTPQIFVTGASQNIVSLITFYVISFLFYGLFVLLRATYPRFRYDALISLAWKYFLPLILSLILIELLIYDPTLTCTSFESYWTNQVPGGSNNSLSLFYFDVLCVTPH